MTFYVPLRSKSEESCDISKLLGKSFMYIIFHHIVLSGTVFNYKCTADFENGVHCFFAGKLPRLFLPRNCPSMHSGQFML
jgi:hypothetical protein